MSADNTEYLQGVIERLEEQVVEMTKEALRLDMALMRLAGVGITEFEDWGMKVIERGSAVEALRDLGYLDESEEVTFGA